MTASLPTKAIETHSATSREIEAPAFRLDAAHYRQEFAAALNRVASGKQATKLIGDFARAFVPGRVKLVTVPKKEAGAPYLRAHDAFEIRPASDRYVSKARTPDYDSLLLQEGMILTPSSGRNLGPVAFVDSYLARFAMTDIMRIKADTIDSARYLFAFLLTPTAQALIRRGRTGTTVDHLAPTDVEGLSIPWLQTPDRNLFAGEIAEAEALLGKARHDLDALLNELHEVFGISNDLPSANCLSRDCGDAFAVSSRQVGLRLDSASHDPTVLACAELIKAKGGEPLSKVATPKTLSRYRRYYVDPPRGRPVLSGRQMLQLRPVNLRHISDRSFANPADFILKAGTTIFTCDGRSEDALGTPAFVMPAWDGWMASEHIMRLEAKTDIGHGFLYLALTSPWVQLQLKSRATGSVIDALEPEEIGHIMLPMLRPKERQDIDRRVVSSWEMISRAINITNSVCERFEAKLHG